MNPAEVENATAKDAPLIGVVPRANVHHPETGVTVVESRYPAAWRWIALALVADVAFLSFVCFGWWIRRPSGVHTAVDVMVGSLTLVAVLLTPVLLVGCLQALRVRRLVVDRDRGVCRLRHLPGFGREFPIADVGAVVIVTFRGLAALAGAAYRCDVALARRGHSRLLRVHTLAGPARVGVQLVPVLRPLAEVLADVLACPIEVEHGVPLRRVSWI